MYEMYLRAIVSVVSFQSGKRDCKFLSSFNPNCHSSSATDQKEGPNG